MSYATIYNVIPGQSAESLHEFRNGHGSAPVIWMALAPEVGLTTFGWISGLSKIEELWKMLEVPAWKRAVLGMTFDGMYIEHKDFAQASKDIRQFCTTYPRDPKFVDHWPALADLLEAWVSDESIQAIGITHTSCGGSVFDGSWNEEADCRVVDWESTWSLYQDMIS